MSAPASGERPPWLVRIWQAADPQRPGDPTQAKPLGAGMYCADGQVVTCAHVIAKPAPLIPPDQPLFVVFTFASDTTPVAAAIEHWYPEPADDVAVLALRGPPPPGAATAPLCSQLGGVGKHAYLTYGYPKGAEEARPSRGQFVAAGQRRLTLHAGGGFRLEHGFSGSPVWNENVDGVLGIIVEQELPRRVHDKLGYDDTRVGYAIPVDEIAKLWTPLAAHIRSPTRADLLARIDALTVLPLRDGELPMVQQVDIYDIGITRSKYVKPESPAPPYVHRRGVDRQLEDELASSPFILAIGPSTSGKSRSTIELLRHVMPAARLIVPTGDAGALRQLASLPLPTGTSGGVVWLDDLDNYLVPNGVDLKVLDDLQRHDPPIKIVATMTSERFKRYTSRQHLEGTSGRTVRGVLGRARVIRIDHELAEEDVAEAQSAYPEEDFRARGIGAQLVATRALEEHYQMAKDVSPAGWAVLQAAVDWRRMGLESPVPESCLRRLFDHYLDDTTLPNADHDQLFGTGLTWAIAPVDGNVAPVFRITTGTEPGYRAFDYLVDLADGQRDIVSAQPVIRPAWSEAIEHVGVQELLSIGFAALGDRLLDVAREAFARGRRQQDDGHVAAWSVLLLGELECELGDPVQGRQLLRDATVSGFPDVVAMAKVDLGAALINDGETAAADELLTTAVAADDPGVSQLAKANLAALRMRQGHIEDAQVLLEDVLAADESESAPLANAHLGELLMGPAGQGSKPLSPNQPVEARRVGGGALGRSGEMSGSVAVQLARANLGDLLLSRGEPGRARHLLQNAVNSGDARVTPFAQARLGWLELAEGNRAEGRQLLESVMTSQHLQARQYAQLGLAELAYKEGETERAQWLLGEIADSGDSEYRALAADLLGDLLVAEGDLAGAQVAYQRAIDAGHPTWSDVAKRDLAKVLSRLPDGNALARARHLLEEVANGENPEQRILAAGQLAELLVSMGDREGAEAVYQQVIDTRHPDKSPAAKIELARLLGRAGSDADLVRAGSLLRNVVASDHPDMAPLAADALGDLLVSQGDIVGAKQAYQQAIDSGHPRWRALALIDLAVLLVDAADDEAALTHLNEATEAADRDVAALAHLRLGYLRQAQGHRVDARKQFTKAVGCGSVDVEVGAEFALAKLEAEDGDLTQAVEHLDLLREWLVDPALAGDTEGDVNGSVGSAFLHHCDFLTDAGEIDAAEELLGVLLEHAEAGGHQALVMATRARLGRVVFLRGDLVQARELLSRAFESVQAQVSGSTTVEPMVRRFLASVLARQEELVSAREVLLPLVNSDDREHRPAGLLLLGELSMIMKEFDEAKKWYEQAIEQAVASQDGDTEERAHQELAELLDRIRPTTRVIDPPPPISRRATSASVLDPVSASDGQVLTPKMLVLVGEIASAEGQHREAQRWLSMAETADVDPELRLRARYSMAVSYLESGDHVQARELAEALESGGDKWTAKARYLRDYIDEARLVTESLLFPAAPSGATGERSQPPG